MGTRAEFRKSQGVVPFGVGAIIDFSEESLMAAGLDVWPSEHSDVGTRLQILEASRVLDGRLARRLSIELKRPISFFLSPTEAPERRGFGIAPRPERAPMPFVRFPNWYFCPRCRVLKEIPWNAQTGGDVLKCGNLGRRVEGKGAPCGQLPKYRRPSLSPVRFVIACERGHIMDFPWRAWAHKGRDKACDTQPGDLYLYSTPAAGLAGVRVGCTRCEASNSMAGAFRQDVHQDIFGSACPGERPWLGPNGRESCNSIPQTIQRGASNAYFAKVVSSILIPPYSARIQQILDRPDVWSEIVAAPLVNGQLHEPFLHIKARNLGVDPTAFVQAIRERFGQVSADREKLEGGTSEEQYRFDEFNAFIGSRPPVEERQDFDIESIGAQQYGGSFARQFDRVVLVKRLRETRVLTGFSRLVPVEALGGACAALSIKPKPWLPGFSVRGEGIFLQLKKGSIEAWRSSNPDVAARIAILQGRLNDMSVRRGTQRRSISADLVLVHTLSHLLIRQLAFECGYDSASIRERIYVSADPKTPMIGLLLYTASGDSEGTLGGMVRQGEPGRLDSTLRAAMKNASICSSDPLCIESDGQGLYSLNMAACHACSLLPETSCEEGNLLLDRALAIGTPRDPQLGYFADVLAEER